MTAFQAAILGIVEGLTEFLPVSSTGHLLVAQRLLGLEDGDASKAYAIAIQAGAIVAVVAVYRARIASIARGLVGQDPAGLKLGLLILAAFAPAAVIGLAFDKRIEAVLFGPWPVVIAWTVGGVVLLGFSRFTAGRVGAGIDALTWRSAVLIGLAQCVAMWPGTSRSLATIVGGVLVGLSLPAAVEFSFLLGLVTLTAATAYTGLKHGHELIDVYGPVAIAIGFVTAAISAFASVKWMLGWLQKRDLAVFGVWRLIAAIAVIALLLTGRM